MMQRCTLTIEYFLHTGREDMWSHSVGSQRCICSFKGEREEVLKHDIEAKVRSEKNLTKCVAVTQGDEAYL